MLPGVEYSITVKVQRVVNEGDGEARLAGLYARAAAVAGARVQDFGGQGVHQWVMCHAWRIVPTGSTSVAMAILMMGLMRPAEGRMPPIGQSLPTRRELMTSGGATMEKVQQLSPQRAAEVFVEFDHRRLAARGAPTFMYSYGERVEVEAIDSFEPFVRRAEINARAHQRRFGVSGTSAAALAIGRREWYRTDNVVTVELHLAASLT